MKKNALWAGFATVALLGIGCGEKTEPIDIATDAVDIAEIARGEAAVYAPFVAKVAPNKTPAEVASDIKASALFEGQDGCTEAEVEEETRVKVPLKDCQSPYGVAGLKGDIHLDVYIGTTGNIHLRSDQNLEAAGGTLDNFNEVVTTPGSASFVVRSEGNSNGPMESELYLYGRHTVTPVEADRCLTIDGQWTSRSPHHDGITFVRNYQRCLDLCPKAGGEVVIRDEPTNTLMTVTFDGSKTAQWNGDGASGTLELNCKTE